MIAHITAGMQTLLTITLVQVSNAFYIASCSLVFLLMYILNINNKTRYFNKWIKPQQYNKLQRYIKQWRFMLAHLNRNIDIFFSTHYMLSAYHIKTNFPQRNSHGDHMATRKGREHTQQELNASSIESYV
jgi:hypothetical protein